MSAGPICCSALMSELARMGSRDHVVVYRCRVCQRVTTLVHFIVDVNVAN